MISVKEATTKVVINWKLKLVYTVLTVVVLFLLNFWLSSYEKSSGALTSAMKDNTIAIGSLGRSLDSLRYNSGYFVDKILDKIGDNKDDLKDHEIRIRELERNR